MVNAYRSHSPFCHPELAQTAKAAIAIDGLGTEASIAPASVESPASLAARSALRLSALRRTRDDRFGSHRHAHKEAAAQGKAPGKILRATDPDARVGHDGNLWIRAGTKAMRGIGTKIDLVMTLRDSERLGQFPGAGTEPPNVFHAAPLRMIASPRRGSIARIRMSPSAGRLSPERSASSARRS